jgi:hypothetical protein
MRKLRKTSQVWLTALAAFSLGSTACAQTYVSGNISGPWPPSGNPYVATANCTVPAGQMLTLQPGVVFLIGSNVTVTANGSLIHAVGTPSQRITISAASSTFNYNTISLINPPGTNLFTYCDFTNAQTAISMGAYSGAVLVDEIFNCTFTSCSSSAIYGEAQGSAFFGAPYTVNSILSPLIKNCIFYNSSNACMMKVYGYYYEGGIGYGIANPSVNGNVFDNLTGTAFLMIIGSYAGGSAPTFINNTLVNCRVGVNATDPWDALIQDNIFVGCTNAVMDLGSLSRKVTYNDFYGNATNSTGYSGIGPTIWNNRNGTPADIYYNIFQSPFFVATNDFHLATNSPCVNAGTPNPAYANMCRPPSIATNFPDLGAYGGPDACNWLTNVPELAVQLSLTQSNSFLWLNWGAIPRSTYLVQYFATNLNATSGTNRWLTNTTLIPAAKPVSIAVSPYPTTNSKAFYRVRSLGRTPGN